jgi:hypothetical protein
MEGLTSPAKEVSTGSGSTIDPTAWKGNSRNFGYRILHSIGPIGPESPHSPTPTAGCIDTGLPADRRNFGQSDKTLIETANVHHAR